jgi:hypothetical protein
LFDERFKKQMMVGISLALEQGGLHTCAVGTRHVAARPDSSKEYWYRSAVEAHPHQECGCRKQIPLPNEFRYLVNNFPMIILLK